MGDFYTSKQSHGDKFSWQSFSASSSGFSSYSDSNQIYVTFTGKVISQTGASTSDTATTTSTYSYSQSNNARLLATNYGSTSNGKGSGQTSNSQSQRFTNVALGAGITYSNVNSNSESAGITTSSNNTADKQTFSSASPPGTFSQTRETTYSDVGIKTQTIKSTGTSFFSTGAAISTYAGEVWVCSSETKPTNSSDTVSTRFIMSSESLELTSYKNSTSTSETYTVRSEKSTNAGNLCRDDCLLATEYYLDDNDVLFVVTGSVGVPLASSQVYGTTSGPASVKIMPTAGTNILSVKKSYIDASITDPSESYTERTTGKTESISYPAYTLNSNLSLIVTDVEYTYGGTGTRSDLIHAPIYALTVNTRKPTTTTYIDAFPYYTTYTSETTNTSDSPVGGNLAGYISLEQTSTILNLPESTTITTTSNFHGTSNDLYVFTTTTNSIGTLTETAFSNVLGNTLLLSGAGTYSRSYTSSAGDDAFISTFSEEGSSFSQSYLSQASSEGVTKYIRQNNISDVAAYESPFNSFQVFTPAMVPGTVAFGGFDDTELYTSNLGHHSLIFATIGDTFTDYDDSFITDNIITRQISDNVSIIPTGKCFNIPSATSATYQWLSSSDWPKSGLSSELSARFASTSTYTTSAAQTGGDLTTMITKTSTDYKSLTMSLSLTNAIEDASATNNFVRYFRGSGVNHEDNMDRPRVLQFPAGHYSITEYQSKQGTLAVSEFFTQSTAAWTQAIEDGIRWRISQERLFYITTSLSHGNPQVPAFITTLPSYKYQSDFFD